MGENNVVTWSENTFLKQSDFQAESNPAAFEDSHSIIKYRYTWTVNSDEIKDRILFFIENILISVEFHPLLSWVRSSQYDDALLKHEQGHFDLAELVKRESLERIQNEFTDKQFPTRGKNEEQRKQFAREDSGRMIANEVEKLSVLFLQKKQKYDQETNFGKDPTRQSEYDSIFERLRL